VIFVGRLTKIKRTERFVDLAKRLLSEGIEARFVVVGDGPERNQLELRAQGIAQIAFVGWRSDMAAVYAAADLVVLTSDNEGMPVALIEAAMQGVPAVATDVGSVREVVLDQTSGYVVAAEDGDALTEAVRMLCVNRPLRDAMGKEARAHAIRHFSEERLVADYEALYLELVSRVPARRKARRRRSGQRLMRRPESERAE
jgi:glycosyltransferase involved in cell wall biosynthesis